MFSFHLSIQLWADGSYGHSISRILRNYRTVFQNGHTVLQFYQQWRHQIPYIIANTCWCFVFFFLILAILASMKWYIIQVWSTFPWKLIMLNIFSYVYCSSLFLCVTLSLSAWRLPLVLFVEQVCQQWTLLVFVYMGMS